MTSCEHYKRSHFDKSYFAGRDKGSTFIRAHQLVENGFTRQGTLANIMSKEARANQIEDANKIEF